MGSDNRCAGAEWLSRDCGRSDRFLQIDKAGAISILVPAAGDEHARASDLARYREGDHPRPFDRRHARHAICTHVSRRGRAARLVNPIGLEDWKALGVPGLSVDQQYQRELGVTPERMRAYEQSTYYAGQWRPEFDKWVNMY